MWPHIQLIYTWVVYGITCCNHGYRERQRQRDRERETETDRQTDRKRVKDIERDRERERGREGGRDRELLPWSVTPVVTVAAMIIICIMFKRKDADNWHRTPVPSRATYRHVNRTSNRPIQNNSNSSPSPPPYTFIPIINPGYEIRTSIPLPNRVATHGTNQNRASMNQGRNFSNLSSGVRRMNPLYENDDEV